MRIYTPASAHNNKGMRIYTPASAHNNKGIRIYHTEDDSSQMSWMFLQMCYQEWNN
jgi:hypothetical protein